MAITPYFKRAPYLALPLISFIRAVFIVAIIATSMTCQCFTNISLILTVKPSFLGNLLMNNKILRVIIMKKYFLLFALLMLSGLAYSDDEKECQRL